MKTNFGKNMRGNWEAVTEVEFDKDASGKERVIQFTTTKRSSGATATTAQVYTVERGMMSFVMFQDYNGIIESEKVRCTEKLVKEQHARALGRMEVVKQAARDYYAKKPK